MGVVMTVTGVRSASTMSRQNVANLGFQALHLSVALSKYVVLLRLEGVILGAGTMIAVGLVTFVARHCFLWTR
jgi:hypothetical protein